MTSLELFWKCFEKIKADHYMGSVATKYVCEDIANEIGRNIHTVLRWQRGETFPDEVNNRPRLEHLWLVLNGGVK